MYTITGAFNRSADAELAIQALHDAGFALDNGPASDRTVTTGDSSALATPDPAVSVTDAEAWDAAAPPPA